MASLGNKNICGLDVAVHDALHVRRIQRLRDFDAQRQQRFHFQRPPADAMLQRRTFQQLHRNECLPRFLPNVVNRADVGMVQRRRRLRLSLETRQRLRILRYIVRQEF